MPGLFAFLYNKKKTGYKCLFLFEYIIKFSQKAYY